VAGIACTGRENMGAYTTHTIWWEAQAAQFGGGGSASGLAEVGAQAILCRAG
jgi:hypothetical protein